MARDPREDPSLLADPGDVDEDALQQSLEVMALEADIRALEMEVGLMDMRRQLEVQERHLEDWKKACKQGEMPSSAKAAIEAAEEQVAVLRRQCTRMEEQRPPRLPSTERAQPQEAVPSEPAPSPNKALPPRPKGLDAETAKRATARSAKTQAGAAAAPAAGGAASRVRSGSREAASRAAKIVASGGYNAVPEVRGERGRGGYARRP
mmetsp:Transcript_19919/g.59694  ORF Transcript_19919/g.59694 Transcript_19919/m.59694 type:complete len:207 (-) Transcript_19919:80-700(-)